MSRLAFREPVALPRPRAALAMAALASLTLALTGQVAWPTLAAAAASMLVVASRGPHPQRWQRSKTLLNLSLVICVGIAIALWLRGMLAVVALAHFALLAQALQLLDARPRRSEFLLVALAVCQVVLAANLTDSALFAPLLVAFTMAVAWTLIVHTVRAEALEAGEPEAARRVLAGGLRRTAVLTSLASVLLAGILFPVLPRIRSGVLALHGSGAPVHRSGFSDRVELGAIGKIRQNSGLMLRVATLQGDPGRPRERYWRGIAFDHFDGRHWAVTPPERTRVDGDPELGIRFQSPPRAGFQVQRITRERIEGGVLFTPERPAELQGSAIGRVQRDINGSLFAPSSEGQRLEYVITSQVLRRKTFRLAQDRAQSPATGGHRFLQLPPLDPRIAALARRVTQGAGTDAARTERLERWLREHGRYTDDLPVYGAGESSPVEDFLLGGIAGHCEYFASSMVVLARTLGIPARVVNGFAGGEMNPLGRFIELRQSDAHTWVEVHYAAAGWVRYDPTPPDLRLAGALVHHGSQAAELISAVELWWFRNVVGFDRAHQLHALERLWGAWHRWRRDVEAPAERGSTTATSHPTTLSKPGVRAWLLVGIALLAALAWAHRQRQQHRSEEPPAYYARALRLLARRGHRRTASTTARGFVRQLAPALSVDAAQAFRRLTESYLCERFAGAGERRRLETRTAGLRDLAALRESLRR